MENSDILTEEQCQKILKRYTETEDFQIKSYSVNLSESQLDGLVCEQYIVKIHYRMEGDEHAAQFFLKTLNGTNKVMFELFKDTFLFEKESFYYETFIPLLESKGLNFNITPRSYLCEPYVVVLEDLSLRSYQGAGKNKSLDLEHCKVCLETLAKFHVESIFYEIMRSEEIGKPYSLQDDFRDILENKIISPVENNVTRFMRCSMKGLLQLIDLIPENGVPKEEFKTKLQDVLNDIMESSGESMGFRNAIIHTDLWSNNFLHRYEDNRIAQSKLIDFQTVVYGPPALDVLIFMHTNTRKTFREEHQNELLKYYYNYFDGLLRESGRLGSEILPEDEFRKVYEVLTLKAKIQCIVDRSITYMSEESFVEAWKSKEELIKFLFEERGKYIVNKFEEDSYFRELMIEDITELREMLFNGW